MKLIKKVKISTTSEEQKAVTFARRFAALSNSLRTDAGLRIAQEKDITHWINPKSRQGSKASNFYSFNQTDYTDLSVLLNKIQEKEERLKNLGYNLDGVKSFNRNVWLDLSRESNAIEGILEDFSYSLLDFRTKLTGEVFKDSNVAISDHNTMFYELKHQLDKVRDNNDCIIIEGNRHKHSLNFSTICHFTAFKYVYNCAQFYKDKKMSADVFLEILNNAAALISNNNITPYRKEAVYVFGAPWDPVSYDKIFEKMKKLAEWVVDEKQSGRLHPIEKAALFHLEFVRIHPYMDGNGRTGRIMSNFILMLSDMPTISLRAKHRDEYFEAENKAIVTHDADDIIGVFYSALCNSVEDIDQCLNYISLTETPAKTK